MSVTGTATVQEEEEPQLATDGGGPDGGGPEPGAEDYVPPKQVMYAQSRWQVVRTQAGPLPIVVIAHTPTESLTFPVSQESANTIAGQLLSLDGLTEIVKALQPEQRAHVLSAQGIVTATPADIINVRQNARPTFRGV